MTECKHSYTYGGVKYEILTKVTDREGNILKITKMTRYDQLPLDVKYTRHKYYDFFYCTKCTHSIMKELIFTYDMHTVVQFGATPIQK